MSSAPSKLGGLTRVRRSVSTVRIWRRQQGRQRPVHWRQRIASNAESGSRATRSKVSGCRAHLVARRECDGAGRGVGVILDDPACDVALVVVGDPDPAVFRTQVTTADGRSGGAERRSETRVSGARSSGARAGLLGRRRRCPASVRSSRARSSGADERGEGRVRACGQSTRAEGASERGGRATCAGSTLRGGAGPGRTTLLASAPWPARPSTREEPTVKRRRRSASDERRGRRSLALSLSLAAP